jgi:hypothetical protein
VLRVMASLPGTGFSGLDLAAAGSHPRSGLGSSVGAPSRNLEISKSHICPASGALLCHEPLSRLPKYKSTSSSQASASGIHHNGLLLGNRECWPCLTRETRGTPTGGFGRRYRTLSRCCGSPKRIALRATLGATAAITAGHTAGALCGAATGNHNQRELKSRSYEGLTRRGIFQSSDIEPEIDHRLWISSFWPAFVQVKKLLRSF